jgi:hypothetical protein
MSARQVTHEQLRAVVQARETDYSDYGGQIIRWADKDKSYPDCSQGCRWAAWLEGSLGGDLCVCAKLDGPRAGLLTFEHQAGFGCFEAKG